MTHLRGQTTEADSGKMSSRAVRKALKRLEAQKELEKNVTRVEQHPEEDEDEDEAEDFSPAPVNPFAMVHSLKNKLMAVE